MIANELLTPVSLGALRLENRVIMSPMTRMRADADQAPPDYVGTYYAQRATAGLIISESIAIRNYGDGWPNVPGLYTDTQLAAWRSVVNAVHARGGLIAAQLWHVGRARLNPPGEERPKYWALTDELHPHDLDAIDIVQIPLDFARAAQRAREIGFDAVEIHSGSSNLLDRFLRPSANLRVDHYGGDTSNRTRLTREIVAAVANAIGPDRVGIKFSPSAPVRGESDTASSVTFASLLADLSRIELAYVHVTRVTHDDRARGWGEGLSFEEIRDMYRGRLIGAGDFVPGDGRRAVESGVLDAVAFGRVFLANPDLVRRIALDAPLNAPDHSTFYAPGPRGLTDYPTLET
ncbi:alkene reductase [Paraburkholderia ginsengiterrae]|uniref:oxidoreductase n=1 Tax=Paraburkholderia ginsengiterrae TaxID=1462993 RepID=UPI0009502158|nr:alkene reductase [Paraburkholderia ginsengiterrae]